MRLAGALHRMIAGIDPGHRRDRAELAEFGVGDVAVVDDIGIVADLGFEQNRARADIGIAPERAIAHIGGRMDERLFGQNLLHVSSTNATRSEAKRERVVRIGTPSVSASTLSTTSKGRPSASFKLSASAASAMAAVTRVRLAGEIAHAEIRQHARHRVGRHGIDARGIGEAVRRQPSRRGDDRNAVGLADALHPDHGRRRLELEPLGNFAVGLFDAARDEAAADGMAGAADDFRKPRAAADRIGDAVGFDISAAAALGAHQAAFGERRDGAAHGVAIDAEPLGDFGFRRQFGSRLESSLRDRLLDLVGNAPPQRDAAGRGFRFGAFCRMVARRVIRTYLGVTILSWQRQQNFIVGR